MRLFFYGCFCVRGERFQLHLVLYSLALSRFFGRKSSEDKPLYVRKYMERDGSENLIVRGGVQINRRAILYVDPPQNVHTTWDLEFASWAFGLRPHMGPI